MNNPFAQPWFSLWSQATPSWADQAFAPNTPPSMDAMWQQASGFWQDMLGQMQVQSAMTQAEQAAKQAMTQMQRLFEQFDGQTNAQDAANAWRSLFEQAGNQNALWEMLPNYWRQQHHQVQQQQQWLDAQIKPWLHQWQQHLNQPALGLYREHQEQWVALMQSHMQSQEKAKAFQDVMQQATEQAFAMFEDQLAAHAEPGRQLSSLRAVYDLWIDSAEEAFADVASSKEYQQAYGEMVDAQMRAKQKLQAQISQWTASLGMPTRDEVDSAHKRVHELMRSVHAMKQEIASLKRQLAANEVDQKEATSSTVTLQNNKKAAPKAAIKTAKKASKKAVKKAGQQTSKKSTSKTTTKARTGQPMAIRKAAKKTSKASVTKATKKKTAKKTTDKKVAKTPRKAQTAPKATLKAVAKKAVRKTARKAVRSKAATKKTRRKAALKASPKPAIK